MDARRVLLAVLAGGAAIFGVLTINGTWLTPGAHSDSVAYLFRLRPGSAAVDRGTVLPTVTDGFTAEVTSEAGVHEVNLATLIGSGMPDAWF
jgi:hypothetical protein